MRRISLLISITSLTSAVMFSARASGPFDGKWIGTAPEAGDFSVLTVTLIVTDNTIAGTVSGKHGSPSINPALIASDGTVQIKYGPFQAGIRFSGDQSTGKFQTRCGVRDTAGKRSQ